MSDDLVVRLRAAIEQQVKDTLSISAGRFVEGMAGRQVDPELSRYLDTVADPDAVIRLCQSHRDILAMYEEARKVKKAMSPMPDLDHASAMGRLTTLGLVVEALARGYGLEDQ